MSDIYTLLTSVGPKPFLNINCNNITCNELIAKNIIDSSPLVVFNYEELPGVFGLPAGARRTNACTSPVVPNADFVIATNIFTVPITGTYVFDLQLNVRSAIVQDISCTVTFFINGIINTLSYTQAFHANVVDQTQSLSNHNVLNLVAGNTVSYQIQNTGTTAIQVFATRFSGQQIL